MTGLLKDKAITTVQDLLELAAQMNNVVKVAEKLGVRAT